MRIVWTRHAVERQREWERKIGVTREEVEWVVRDPEQVVSGARGSRVAQTRTRGGLLRVPFVETPQGRKVLTVYWTSKVGKYWEGGEQCG